MSPHEELLRSLLVERQQPMARWGTRAEPKPATQQQLDELITAVLGRKKAAA